YTTRCHCHAFCLSHHSGDHRDLHSFPTRRSSDLESRASEGEHHQPERAPRERRLARRHHQPEQRERECEHRVRQLDEVDVADERSEEHTSELQSLAYLVCRLLLEKKNTAQIATTN